MIIVTGTIGPTFKAIQACLSLWIDNYGIPRLWQVNTMAGCVVVYCDDWKLLTYIAEHVRNYVASFDGKHPRRPDHIITNIERYI